MIRRKYTKRTPKDKAGESGGESDGGGSSPKKFTNLKPGQKRRGRPPKCESAAREGGEGKSTVKTEDGEGTPSMLFPNGES